MDISALIIVLLTLAAGESAPREPVSHAWLRAGSVLLGAILVAGSAELSVWKLRGRLKCWPHLASHWGWRFRRLQKAHHVLWLLSTFCMLYVAGWPQLVRTHCATPLTFLDQLLVLTPVLLPLIAGWAAFLRFEHTVDCLLADCRGEPRPAPRLRQQLLDQCKASLGLVLPPVLMTFALHDALRLTMGQRQLEAHGWVLHLVVLVAMVGLMPAWLRVLWSAQPMTAGSLRDRLLQTAAAARLRLRDILVLSTEAGQYNAAVSGLLPQLRYVYLTRSLVELLEERELEAVLLHEAAHVRRRHLPIRMLVLLMPIALALAVQATCPGALDTTSRWLLAHGVPATWQGALLLPAAAATYLLVAMGTISRRLELDADRWVAQQGAGDALASALTKLAERDPHPDKATWLHPSLQSRIEAIVAQAASL